MPDDPPEDWEAQIARAYETFGVDPLNGADELGYRVWRRNGVQNPFRRRRPNPDIDVPMPPQNPEFERKIRRDEIGRFADKPRGSLYTDKPFDISTPPSPSDRRRKRIGTRKPWYSR